MTDHSDRETDQSESPAPERATRLFILLLFFLSGFSALAFETLWQKKLMLIFGASAPATVAIFTALFLGIALGSLLGGRILRKSKTSALKLYAYTELWIGVTAIIVPFLIPLVDLLNKFLVRGEVPLPNAWAFAMTLCILLPPTLGMGATIPLMNRILHRNKGIFGRSVSLAFGVNTLGAVAGCLATALILIRLLGIQNSILFAALINGLLFAAALWLNRQSGTEEPEEEVASAGDRPDAASLIPGMSRRFIYSIYIISSFVALGLEVAWIRVVNIYTASSNITFALTLSVFLTGFALGSLIAYRILSRFISQGWVLVVSNLGVAASTLILIQFTSTFPGFALSHIYEPASEGQAISTLKLLIVEGTFPLVLMFVPTVFMGMIYPAACQLVSAEGRSFGGTLYSVGTLASSLGALVVGLWIIPLLGLVGTIGAGCIASSLVALAIAWTMAKSGTRLPHVIAYSLTLTSAVFALWYGLQGSPFFKTGKLVKQGDDYLLITPQGEEHETMIRLKEGASASVAVSELRIGDYVTRQVYIDGQPVASTEKSAKADAKMLAHIPLALHPDPESALTVGFGSGGTSHSMTLHGIQVDAAEIEPEVIRSAYLFEEQNYGILSKPNFNLVLNDARYHLHTTSKLYDVISTDSTNLKYKQNGSLYTKEYFELMDSRLTDDGIACAWIPMAGINGRDLRTLIRTFADVFPHTSLWIMNQSFTSYGILIGTPDPLSIDIARVQSLFLDEGIRKDLGKVSVENVSQFVHLLHLDEHGVDKYVGKGPLHTDDRPVLDFGSLVANYQFYQTFARNIAQTSAYRPAEFESFVPGLPVADVPGFRQYTAAAGHWTECIFRYYSYGAPGEEKQKIEHLRLGLVAASKSVIATPRAAPSNYYTSVFVDLLRSEGIAVKPVAVPQNGTQPTPPDTP